MNTSLEGKFPDFTVREVLLLLSNQHSGTFTAQSSQGDIRLVMRNGKVDHFEPAAAADAAEILAPFISVESGSFSFNSDLTVPDGAKALGLEVPALLDEATRRDEENRKRGSYKPGDRFKVVDQPAVNQIQLSAREFQLLFQIGSGKSLGELITPDLPESEVRAMVEKLDHSGLIERLARPKTALVEHEPKSPKAPVAPVAAASDKTVVYSGEDATLIEVPPASGEPTRETMLGTLTTDDGRMHPLFELITTIGRTSINTICINDGSVSNRHAQITRGDRGFWIEDLSSRNGTFVNGEKVLEKKHLTSGDIIRLGKILLTFHMAIESHIEKTTEGGVKPLKA